MGWRDTHEAFAAARAAVHDELKKPVNFSSDNGVNWRPVFCRLWEKSNPDGQTVGRAGAQMTVDTDIPKAVFFAADVPDLKKDCIISYDVGTAYLVHQSVPKDRHGYQTVQLKRDQRGIAYPPLDWDAL